MINTNAMSNSILSSQLLCSCVQYNTVYTLYNIHDYCMAHCVTNNLHNHSVARLKPHTENSSSQQTISQEVVSNVIETLTPLDDLLCRSSSVPTDIRGCSSSLSFTPTIIPPQTGQTFVCPPSQLQHPRSTSVEPSFNPPSLAPPTLRFVHVNHTSSRPQSCMLRLSPRNTLPTVITLPTDTSSSRSRSDTAPRLVGAVPQQSPRYTDVRTKPSCVVPSLQRVPAGTSYSFKLSVAKDLGSTIPAVRLVVNEYKPVVNLPAALRKRYSSASSHSSARTDAGTTEGLAVELRHGPTLCTIKCGVSQRYVLR